MKILANMILRIFFFGVASWLFPVNVCIKDVKTLVTVVAITMIIEAVGASLTSLAMLFLVRKKFMTSIMWIGFVLIYIYTTIEILLTEYFVTGFEINGMATYIVLILAMSLIRNDEGVTHD